MLKMKTLLITILLVSSLRHAHAGLIIFTDREAFALAAGSPLVFDGFNDPGFTTVSLSSGSGFKRYRTTSSHVSEGVKAVSLKEYDSFTIDFNYDVFAFGFDINELNSNSLSYRDSAGNSIIEVLKVTELWNASTFFRVKAEPSNCKSYFNALL